MAATYQTNIVVSATNKAGGVLQQVQRQASTLASSLSRAGTAMQLTGFRASAAISAPAIMLAKGLVDTANEYSKTKNALQSVIEGGILDDAKNMGQPLETGLNNIRTAMEALGDEADRLAGMSKYDPVEVTNAQKLLGMAGMSADQVLGSSQAVVVAATALDMDVGEVADQISNLALSFDFDMSSVKAAEESTMRLADLAAYAASSANVNGQEFFKSMESLGPVSVATGMSIEQMGAMVATMADKGIKGAYAGVALRSSIARMLAPTKQVRAAFETMNIQIADYMKPKAAPKTADLFGALVASGEVQASQLAPLTAKVDAILADSNKSISKRMGEAGDLIASSVGLKGEDSVGLTTAIGGYTSSLMESFDFFKLIQDLGQKDQGMLMGTVFGKNHFTKILGLIQSAGGMVNFEQALLDNAEGTAMRMLETRMKGVYGELQRLRTAWVRLKTDMLDSGGKGAILRLSQAFRSMLDAFRGLSDGAKMLIVNLTLIGAVSGPLLIYLGMVVQSMGVLTGVTMALSRALIGVPLRAFAGLMVAAAGGATAMSSALIVAGAAVAGVGMVAFMRIRDAIGGATDEFWSNTSAVLRWSQAWEGIKEQSVRVVNSFLTGDSAGVRAGIILLKYYAKNIAEMSKELAGILIQSAGEGLLGADRFNAVKSSVLNIVEDIKNAFANARAAVMGFFEGLRGEGEFLSPGAKLIEMIGKVIDAAGDAVIALAELFSVKPDPGGWIAWGKSVGDAVRSAFLIDADPDANDPRSPKKQNAIEALGLTAGAAQVGIMAALSSAMQTLGTTGAGMATRLLSGVAALSGLVGVLARFAGKAAMLWAISEAILAIYSAWDDINSIGDLGNVLMDAFSTPAEWAALGAAVAFAFRKPIAAMAARLGLLLISPVWASAGGIAASLFSVAFSAAAKAGKFLGDILYAITDPKRWMAAGARAGSIFQAAMAGVRAVFTVAKIVAVGVWRAAGALAMLTFQTAMWAGKALFTVAKVIGTGVFRVAGTMAGAMFSAAFQLAMLGLKAAKLLGGLAWRAAGLAAGGLWSAGFKMASVGAGVAGSIIGSLGSAITTAGVGGAGGWGKTILRFLGKGLLRAIPFVGIGLIAYELGKYIWDNFSEEIMEVLGELKTWFAEKLAAALKVGEDLKASIVSTFSAIGDAISDAIKAPFDDVVDYFSQKLQAIMDMAMALGVKLGIISPEARAIAAPPDMPMGAMERRAFGVTSSDGALGPLSRGIQWNGLFPGADFEGGGGTDGLSGGLGPGTFKEQGVEVGVADAVSGNTELLKFIADALTGGQVKSTIDGQARVEVRLIAPAGMGTVTSTTNTGDVKATLNTGSDPTGPF